MAGNLICNLRREIPLLEGAFIGIACLIQVAMAPAAMAQTMQPPPAAAAPPPPSVITGQPHAEEPQPPGTPPAAATKPAVAPTAPQTNPPPPAPLEPPAAIVRPPQIPAAAGSEPQRSGGLPSTDAVIMLVRSTLIAFNDANLTGNYQVLHALASPSFQHDVTVEKLGDSFKAFRELKIDLTPVAVLVPTFTKLELDNKGVLHVEGLFPSQPLQLRFNLAYQAVDGRWRYVTLSAEARQVQAAAGPLAPQPPAAPAEPPPAAGPPPAAPAPAVAAPAKPQPTHAAAPVKVERRVSHRHRHRPWRHGWRRVADLHPEWRNHPARPPATRRW